MSYVEVWTDMGEKVLRPHSYSGPADLVALCHKTAFAAVRDGFRVDDTYYPAHRVLYAKVIVEDDK